MHKANCAVIVITNAELCTLVPNVMQSTRNSHCAGTSALKKRVKQNGKY